MCVHSIFSSGSGGGVNTAAKLAYTLWKMSVYTDDTGGKNIDGAGFSVYKAPHKVSVHKGVGTMKVTEVGAFSSGLFHTRRATTLSRKVVEVHPYQRVFQETVISMSHNGTFINGSQGGKTDTQVEYEKLEEYNMPALIRWYDKWKEYGKGCVAFLSHSNGKIVILKDDTRLYQAVLKGGLVLCTSLNLLKMCEDILDTSFKITKLDDFVILGIGNGEISKMASLEKPAPRTTTVNYNYDYRSYSYVSTAASKATGTRVNKSTTASGTDKTDKFMEITEDFIGRKKVETPEYWVIALMKKMPKDIKKTRAIERALQRNWSHLNSFAVEFFGIFCERIDIWEFTGYDLDWFAIPTEKIDQWEALMKVLIDDWWDYEGKQEEVYYSIETGNFFLSEKVFDSNRAILIKKPQDFMRLP